MLAALMALPPMMVVSTREFDQRHQLIKRLLLWRPSGKPAREV
jgi:hypothetical protein